MLRGTGFSISGAAASATAVMVNGDTIFTIAGGPIEILQLQSVCITVNDTTASTLQYRSVPTVGTATTISAASGSLAAAGTGAGATVTLNATSLATAPDIVASTSGGVQLGAAVANRIIVQAGTIKIVIGVGSTTGTWKHYISYRPLAPGVTVS